MGGAQRACAGRPPAGSRAAAIYRYRTGNDSSASVCLLALGILAVLRERHVRWGRSTLPDGYYGRSTLVIAARPRRAAGRRYWQTQADLADLSSSALMIDMILIP